jgi:ribonuclease T1
VAGRVARRVRRPQLALIVLLAVLIVGYTGHALRDHEASRQASGTVALSTLPAQVTTTVELIEHGGPFPYRQDGVVFDNAEKHLPAEPRGFYHEYTVPTPGSADRGARRIIAGRDGTYYYTSDHYESFVRVVVTE